MSHKYPKNGLDPVVYELTSLDIGDLEGRILTFIDASISDPVQRKAMKDIISPMIWTWVLNSSPMKGAEIGSN